MVVMPAFKKRETNFMFINDENLVGRIGLYHLNIPNKSGATGYWPAKTEVWEGRSTRCCLALLQYGFELPGLNSIEIKAAVQNLKSRAIPARSGFRKEGVLGKAGIVNNRPLDLF